jgi:AGZA family xanthine/uracil permease-like MFS transporter
MAPIVAIFLFMVFFDTVGTLVGVAQQAGLMRDDRLPRARQAFVSDAVGTVAGACLGTSTVTSYIESATGVEQGGRTGLTAVTVAALFLVALFFSPIVQMLGGYPPITAPALVLVGGMMLRNVRHLAWDDYTELLPSFLVLLGIPLSYSIADGLALGFIAYPLLKALGGRVREVRWMSWFLAALLVAYFVLVRSHL